MQNSPISRAPALVRIGSFHACLSVFCFILLWKSLSERNGRYYSGSVSIAMTAKSVKDCFSLPCSSLASYSGCAEVWNLLGYTRILLFGVKKLWQWLREWTVKFWGENELEEFSVSDMPDHVYSISLLSYLNYRLTSGSIMTFSFHILCLAEAVSAAQKW